jgi:hypothetical protein
MLHSHSAWDLQSSGIGGMEEWREQFTPGTWLVAGF